MIIRIDTTNKVERERIKYKGSDGTCSVMVEEQELEGLIVGISSNGTYIIQTLDEIGSLPEGEKKQTPNSDQVQQVEEDFLR